MFHLTGDFVSRDLEKDFVQIAFIQLPFDDFRIGNTDNDAVIAGVMGFTLGDLTGLDDVEGKEDDFYPLAWRRDVMRFQKVNRLQAAAKTMTEPFPLRDLSADRMAGDRITSSIEERHPLMIANYCEIAMCAGHHQPWRTPSNNQ